MLKNAFIIIEYLTTRCTIDEYAVNVVHPSPIAQKTRSSGRKWLEEPNTGHVCTFHRQFQPITNPTLKPGSANQLEFKINCIA